jgi:hypothetical protein
MTKRIGLTVLGLLGLLVFSGCDISDLGTDGATRIANDIGNGASAVGPDEGATITINHKVKAWPEGCPGDYHVEFVQAPGSTHSIVGIWCKVGGVTKGSHVTSSQSRFVSLEKTFRFDKKAGETLFIVLKRKSGQVTVDNVY